MSKYPKSRSTQPARGYRSSAGKSAGRYAGLKWIIIGILIGVMLAVWLNWKYTQHPSRVNNRDAILSRAVAPSQTPTAAPAAPKPLASAEAPAAPQFDFYTMLPKMQVAAANNQPQPAPAQSQPTQPSQAVSSAPMADANPVPAPSAVNEAVAPAATSVAPASPLAPQSPVAPPSAENSADAGSQYWLQVGTVREYAAVDQLKAQLAMLGLDVTVEKFKADSQLYYRVSVGPYSSRQGALVKQKQLKDSGLASMIVKKP